MKKYTLTRKAEQDIRNIWSYTIDEWGEVQAERYLKGLEEKLELLSDSPDSIGKNRDSLKSGYMSSLYEKHIVFFKKAGNSIEIIRVLHQRMDISNRI